MLKNFKFNFFSFHRSCGKVLCSQCCNYKAKLPYLENKEARVCQLCYGILIRSNINLNLEKKLKF